MTRQSLQQIRPERGLGAMDRAAIAGPASLNSGVTIPGACPSASYGGRVIVWRQSASGYSRPP
jgi:hypothetical protein